jgi:LuxR family maltose regulon positive regulatory protein
LRNTSGEVGLLSEAAELSIIAGKLKSSYELYLRALAAGPSLAIAGIPLAGLGEVEREWNRLEEAEVHIREGLRRTREWGTVVSLDGLLSLARIQRARGEAGAAWETLEEAKARAASFDVTELDDAFVAAHRARMAIAVGDLEATDRWVAEWAGTGEAGVHRVGGSISGTIPRVYHIWELERITMARLHLARGEFEDALVDLLPVAEEAARKGRYGSVVELEMLRAVAYEGLGQPALAMAAMKESLALGEPEGYMRVYLDEGTPVTNLVYRAASEGIFPEYAGRILAEFSSADVAEALRNVSDHSSDESDSVVEPLSDRELQVLRLLARGMSNKEIAEELYVSVRTVKFHTGNIYERLSAKNRTEAVAKARALGIISDQ